MHELYDLKEMLCNTLKEYSKKAEINTQSLDIVDKLAHAIKNLDKIIENYEAGGESHRDNGNQRLDVHCLFPLVIGLWSIKPGRRTSS